MVNLPFPLPASLLPPPLKPPAVQNWVAGYIKNSRGSPLLLAQQAINVTSNAQRLCRSPLGLIFCFFSSLFTCAPATSNLLVAATGVQNSERETLLCNPQSSGPKRVGQTPIDFVLPLSSCCLSLNVEAAEEAVTETGN